MKRITLLLSLVCSLSFTYANECSGWKVKLTQSSVSLCNPQTLDFDVILTHDSLTLDSCKYEWYIKLPSSSSHIMFSNSKSTFYAFNDFGDYLVYVKVTPNECPDIYSDTTSIVRYRTLTAGSIIGADTICYNTIPSPLKLSTSPMGGAGQLACQWQQKTTTDWENISNATETTYTPNQLKTTTTYRLQFTNDCGTVYSNEQTITVRPALSAPIVSDHNETICYATTPSVLSLTTLATGGDDDSFTYQWQQSTNGTNFEDILGATNLTYQPEAITVDHYYRVVATSVKGCGSIISSNVTKVSVLPDLAISTYGIDPLCFMSRGDIRVAATGAGDDYTYQWQISTDSITFTDCTTNAHSATYKTPASATGTYYYRCIVTPTHGCAAKTSDVITVVVYENIVPGSIVGADTICYNSIPDALTLSTHPTGSNGQFTYQWQERANADWIDISGATSASYSPASLVTTTTYRLQFTNDCGTVYSNEQTITVRPALSAPIVSDHNETICYATTPSVLSLTTLATGGDDDSFTYQWQQSTNGTNFEDILGATNLTYQPEAITVDHYYRVVATSVKGCGSIISSNVTKVSVLPDLAISTYGIDPLCFMSRGDIRVAATGAGDDYTYQWQISTDSITFTDCTTNAHSATYKTPASAAGTYYYRCIVTPTYGCAAKTSDVITVVVYEEITPSVIAGADTICYGFAPNQLFVNVPASGGDGVFTYAWMQKVEGTSVFTYISGADQTTYQPNALTKTTDYKLEITNACGIYESNIIQIYVRDQLTAPIIISSTDTICYNTIPNQITCAQVAVGGIDDSFIYQWQESTDGQNYTDISGETNLTYQPETMLVKHYYRLQATSDKQCGVLYSNVVEVNVFDSLNITASVVSPICYLTSANLSVVANGGGNSYTYQWQQSADSILYTDIPNAFSSDFTTSPLTNGTYYYRCIVTSSKCDAYSRISNSVKVDVYEPLSAGTIVGVDSTCYSYAPNGMLTIDENPSGVDGNFSYQWQQRITNNWEDIPNATEETYAPNALFEQTEYRLQVASICDTLYTNGITIRINPLPEIQEISGASEVCYNQHEIYSIDKLNEGFTYQWFIDNNHGELTTDAINTTSVDILWKTPNQTDVVKLLVINEITGCESTINYNVAICNETAPDRTTIVRKPNSNILLCQEDRDIHYQWGYTDKTTQTEHIIDDSNRRYVLLPSAFDNTNYDYWLTLRYDATSKCYSRSYYAEENDTIITQTGDGVSVPSLIHGRIPIIVQNEKEENVTVEIYTVCGQLYGRQSLGNASYVDTTLPFVLPSGVYTLRAQIGTYVKTIKLIAQ